MIEIQISRSHKFIPKCKDVEQRTLKNHELRATKTISGGNLSFFILPFFVKKTECSFFLRFLSFLRYHFSLPVFLFGSPRTDTRKYPTRLIRIIQTQEFQNLLSFSQFSFFSKNSSIFLTFLVISFSPFFRSSNFKVDLDSVDKFGHNEIMLRISE